MSQIEIDGFVIVPPLSTWDEKRKDEIINSLSHCSFGITTVEAWKRLIHHSQYEYEDFSIIIQRWHNKGYRPVKAKLVIYND
jgi:hypothetical protein